MRKKVIDRLMNYIGDSSYSKEDFNDEEQIRLRDFCALLNEHQNIDWMLSNADCSARTPSRRYRRSVLRTPNSGCRPYTGCDTSPFECRLSM